MKFEELNKLIPYAMGGKAKVLRMQPYNAITLRLPGRHAKDTEPKGGDFCVCVDDENMDWTEHQFTHDDIFNDINAKRDSNSDKTFELMGDYLKIIKGDDPAKLAVMWDEWDDSVHPVTFLYAVQCLAVAEHRRYAKFEDKWGGRYLPFRFAAGIEEGLWNASDAIGKQKYGRPGVEELERKNGLPILTKELMA